nr:MAG TPA: hypothetical protein [Caudoviricetes sp.]
MSDKGVRYIKRKEYNNVISVKLVIPSSCNANCSFCYMKSYKNYSMDSKDFMNNFITSLSFIIDSIGNKNPISLDITGNEPTYDIELLKKILLTLKNFNIKDKVLRTTITTNGYHIKELIPYFEDVIDYVSISVHDFRETERKNILGCNPLSDSDYISIISNLKKIGIKTSAISVIYREIDDFHIWKTKFIEWCKQMGFIALRFRCDVFWQNNYMFDKYMKEEMKDNNYQIITYENTPDSHWCRLRRYDGFRLFFLHGVLDTSILTKGIEYVIAEDGLLYCDFYKKTKIEDYEYEIGCIYDIKR